MFYEEAGDGNPPIVLVHGWCCDHTYFAPQFEHFRRAQRVVAVDLRGHGESAKATRSGRSPTTWLCGEFGLVKPVVVGHTMGGIVAFDLACRYPGLPAAIVMLDAAVVLPAGQGRHPGDKGGPRRREGARGGYREAPVI